MEQPRTIPEKLGFAKDIVPRIKEGDPPRNAQSYVAMYGLTFDEAEALLQRCATHSTMVREINNKYVQEDSYRARLKTLMAGGKVLR